MLTKQKHVSAVPPGYMRASPIEEVRAMAHKPEASASTHPIEIKSADANCLSDAQLAFARLLGRLLAKRWQEEQCNETKRQSASPSRTARLDVE